jgi:hypothetical protein
METLIWCISEKIKELLERGKTQTTHETWNYQYFIRRLKNGKILILRASKPQDWHWSVREEDLENEFKRVFYLIYDFPLAKIEDYQISRARKPNVDVRCLYGDPDILLLDKDEVLKDEIMETLKMYTEFFKA